jgi:hypothetical protein
MLGDQIGELKGKITGQRVLAPEEGGLAKIEYSFSDNGMMKEVNITHMATFWTIPRESEVLYGEGQGVIITTDDSAEMATEIGH